MGKTADISPKVRFSKKIRKRFFRNFLSRVAFYLLILLCFIALFAPYIANDQPLYVQYHGKTYYPAFRSTWLAKNVLDYAGTDTIVYEGKTEILQFDITDWRKKETAYILWPLVPFSPDKPDYYNRDFVAPSDEQLEPLPDGTTQPARQKFTHLLGTDDLGRDVLSGLIHGTRISLAVGILSMAMATLLGLIIGVLSGYFGDRQLKLSRLAMLLFLPALVISWFYAFIAFSDLTTEAFEHNTFKGVGYFLASVFLFVGLLLLLLYLANRVKGGWLGHRVAFPMDAVLSRDMEIFNALPKLLLVISITAVIEQRSIMLVILVIGLTSWTEIARYTRAELLRIRELDYIGAARVMGLGHWRIILKHALPNALSPVLVVISFGIAGAVLIESGLSFLGIGVPEETVTWGSMLNKGRMEMEAWWLMVFPGIAIFLTAMIFNLIGEGWRDAADPRAGHRK